MFSAPGRCRGAVVAVVLTLIGAAAGGIVAAWRPPGRVQAVSSLADESFAACTAPVTGTMEGFFILDFETGDLSGGVLSPTTMKFAVAYRHNVLRDLGFKAGKVKNPKFLLLSGVASFAGQGAAQMGQSVLYVTDVATGVTAAYGIPWNEQARPGTSPVMAELVLLDVAKPRGGGGKAP